MSQAAYRVRQFFGSLAALLARVSEDDLRQADAHLPPQARLLFRRMSAADQRHSLAVMRALQRAGQAQPALLAAALLHDVGKSAAWLTPVHRAIIVLLGRFWPAALGWLSREPASGWRRSFVVQRTHAELGAQWAEQAGCQPASVTLIRRHQEPPPACPRDELEAWLVQLQAADKNC